TFGCGRLGHPPDLFFPFNITFLILHLILAARFLGVHKELWCFRELQASQREQFSGFNRALDDINNVFRKFSAFHDETGRLNVDGMNIISNDGSNKLNRSRKASVSYIVQRTINASLNAASSTISVSSNPNFVTRQKIEIIFG